MVLNPIPCFESDRLVNRRVGRVEVRGDGAHDAVHPSGKGRPHREPPPNAPRPTGPLRAAVRVKVTPSVVLPGGWGFRAECPFEKGDPPTGEGNRTG